MTKIKPLIQLREMIAAALSSMTNLSKTFEKFIIDTMQLFLTSSGRMNFTQKCRGRKPNCTKGMEDPDSLTGWYLRMLSRLSKQLLSICNLIVADAHFSKESFVSGVKNLGFNIISRFRDDVNLKYLYRGPKARKRGRPQKFAGKVDLKHLDMTSGARSPRRRVSGAGCCPRCPFETTTGCADPS